LIYNINMDTRKFFNKQSGDSINASQMGGKMTAKIEEGPYYKANSPERIRLFEEGIPGEKLILTGYVLDRNKRPIEHAWLNFWQANGNGIYDNSGNTLRGHQYTDKSGKYRLETVIPGGYSTRTPHIHVKVRANTESPILTTQLFIPGKASNKTDFLYREDLLVDLKDTSGGKVATFNFIIERAISSPRN
jgi:protocatechuate 3,4-dioxygenase beta subunit